MPAILVAIGFTCFVGTNDRYRPQRFNGVQFLDDGFPFGHSQDPESKCHSSNDGKPFGDCGNSK